MGGAPSTPYFSTRISLTNQAPKLAYRKTSSMTNMRILRTIASTHLDIRSLRNTESDGSGTSYSDGQRVKNIYNEYGYGQHLYAQWEANKYTVKFDANGGTGTMPSQTLTYDKNERLNRSTFKAPAGKMIAGWNTKADGTGTGMITALR